MAQTKKNCPGKKETKGKRAEEEKTLNTNKERL